MIQHHQGSTVENKPPPRTHFDPGSPNLRITDSQESVYVCSPAVKWAMQDWTHVFITFFPLAVMMETLDEIPPAVTFHLDHFGLKKHTSSFFIPPRSPFGTWLNLGQSFLFHISVIDYTNLESPQLSTAWPYWSLPNL